MAHEADSVLSVPFTPGQRSAGPTGDHDALVIQPQGLRVMAGQIHAIRGSDPPAVVHIINTYSPSPEFDAHTQMHSVHDGIWFSTVEELQDRGFANLDRIDPKPVPGQHIYCIGWLVKGLDTSKIGSAVRLVPASQLPGQRSTHSAPIGACRGCCHEWDFYWDLSSRGE